MAYLRKDTKTLEIDYPMPKVWDAIKETLLGLGLDPEQVDDDAHHLKAKTKSGFLRLSSLILVDAAPAGGNKTKISVTAEKPVTTITGIMDFGQASQLTDAFLAELARLLKK